MRRNDWTLIAALGLAFGLFGCDDTWRGVKKDTKENTETAKEKAHEVGLDEAAKKAAVKAEEAADAAGRGIKKVAHDLTSSSDDKTTAPAPADKNDTDRAIGKAQARLEETGRDIAEGARGAGVHVNVKQALMRAEAIDASRIDVDIDNDRRTVILRGSVPTGAQKAAAEHLAKEHSNGYAVRNELAVMPAP